MKASAFQRGLLLAAALLVAMPLSAAAKCPSGPNGLLLVLDGRQLTQAELDKLNLSNESIEAIDILCWNPANSTFIRSLPWWPAPALSRAPGFRVVRTVSRALVDRLVEELYRASEAAAPSHSSQPSVGSPSAVRGATDGELVVELNADKTQWSATLKRGAMVHTCVLDVGRPSPSTVSERQRTCSFTIAEGEKYVLRTEG